MLVIAFGLMIFVLLLYKFFGQRGPGAVSDSASPPPPGDQLALTSLLYEPAPQEVSVVPDKPSESVTIILPVARTDRLANGGPKLMRPLRKALPIDKQPLIVIGFRPGEDAIEITLPSEDMAEARRLALTPDIRPDPRGGCVVTLGGVTVARVHSTVIGQRDVILREEIAA
jgi:hypothetical protein